MWSFKEGYPYIVVNFGFWHYCKTLPEARKVASEMKPDKGIIYSNGFHSDKVGKWVGVGHWFHVKD